MDPAIIRLRQDLEPNEHHPLSDLNEDVRDQQRQQVFAEILARLANGPTAKSDVTNHEHDSISVVDNRTGEKKRSNQ
jgi:hypothetical protein